MSGPGTPQVDVPGTFRRFVLVRDRDVSGVSGTGQVAFGAQYPSGTVTTQWAAREGMPAQTCVWQSIGDVERVHGHVGATRVVWVDPARDGDGT